MDRKNRHWNGPGRMDRRENVRQAEFPYRRKADNKQKCSSENLCFLNNRKRTGMSIQVLNNTTPSPLVFTRPQRVASEEEVTAIWNRFPFNLKLSCCMFLCASANF